MSARGLGEAVGHPDHDRLLQAEHVAEVGGEVGEHRQLGRARVAEHRRHPARAEQVEARFADSRHRIATLSGSDSRPGPGAVDNAGVSARVPAACRATWSASASSPCARLHRLRSAWLQAALRRRRPRPAPSAPVTGAHPARLRARARSSRSRPRSRTKPATWSTSRILPDLRWIAQRYPIYVTDGYSGPLPSGEHVGCDECHIRGSDHYNGLAVDLVPVGAGTNCDASWTAITRARALGRAAPGLPAPPFRWVGYDGDAGHGCGNHLHLSWNHAAAAQFQLAEWVEVFPVTPGEAEGEAPRGKRAAPKAPPGRPSAASTTVRTGGVAPRYGATDRVEVGGSPRMGRCAAATVTVLACLLLGAGAGCGGQSDSTPVTCLEGPRTYLAALEDGPGGSRGSAARPRSRLPGREPEARRPGQRRRSAARGDHRAQRRGAAPTRAARRTCGSATCSAPPSAAPTRPKASTPT